MKRILKLSMLLGLALAACDDSTTLPPSPTTSCADYEGAIHWIGALTDVQFAGDPVLAGGLLYIPSGYALRIVDVSDPAHPATLGQLGVDIRIRQVLVHERIAYVLTDYSVVTVDATDPANPVALGNVLILPGAGFFDSRGDGFLYITTGTGLQIVDARTPSHPALAGNLSLANVGDVAVAGEFAYVSVSGGKLVIVDVADPRAPQLASTFEVGQPVGALEVFDNRLFAAAYDGVLISSLDDATHPRLLGKAQPEDSLRRFEVQGNRLYIVVSVSVDENAIEVFQVRSNGSPSPLVRFKTPGDIAPAGIAATSEHVFVMDIRTGLQVYELPAPRWLEPTSGFAVGDRVQDIVAAGDYLYVAAWDRGLVIVDISDPDDPSVVGTVDTPNVAEGVAVAGNLAYLADWDSGLHIVDVSDRAAPRILGGVDTPGYAKHVAVSGDYAYVADNSGGLQVIDASDPAAPRLVKTVDTGMTMDVTVQGGFVYTAGFGAMHVVDVADPATAHSVGSVPAYAAWGIAVQGSRVFVAGSTFDIVDVSVPNAPAVMSRTALPQEGRGVAVVGDVAYVAEFLLGAIVIDVSNPVNPRPFGTLGTRRLSHRIVEHAGLILLANLNDGILVAPSVCP